MLLTTRTPATINSNYLDALDYLTRMKNEGKYNENTVGVFSFVYEKEIDILVKQGYFNASNN